MKLNSIFVIGENIESIPALTSAANSLADKVTAVVFGDEEYAKSQELYGADEVIFCDLEEKYSPEDFSELISEKILEDEDSYVFVSNTAIGREIAAKVGVKLDSPVFANVRDISVDEGHLVCSYTVYGGTASRKIKFNKKSGVVTINDGAFDADDSLGTTDTFTEIAGTPSSTHKLVSKSVRDEVSVNLAVAKKIVDIGRSVNSEEELEMYRKLASLLEAEVGCTRPVAENNKLLPASQYMGITGVQANADLILAIGLSGQIQHLGGIDDSKFIVAINKDKAAPIFENADFGLVGDMNKIVPQLIEKLS